MVRMSTGQDKLSGAAVYLDRAPGITPADQVTMPDGATPAILAIDRFADQHGDYCEILWLDHESPRGLL